MPASPYGLGYGLGVMANAIPTQMNERHNMDLQTQMRQLQLAQMKRQEAEQQGVMQAAQSVQPEMEASLNNPTPQLPTTEATPETQASAKGLNLPVPGAIPNAPTPDQMAAVQKPMSITRQQKVYTTPYQAAAHRYGAMSDYLFKQGLVEPAMRLQAQAQQSSQMHQATTLSQAARAASLGSYGDATKMLNGIGMNIAGMAESPDDPDTILIQSTQNGQPMVAEIPKRFLGAMIEDPLKGAQAITTWDWRMGTIDSRERIAAAATAAREKASSESNKTKKEIAQGNWTNRLDVQNARNQGLIKAYGAGGKTPAKLAVWDRAVADTKNMHPDWSPSQVMDEAAKHPLVATAASLKKGDASGAYKILLSKQMEGAEDKAHPLHDLYTEAKTEIANAKKTPTNTAPPPPPPKQNYDGEISPSGKFKFSGGTWVDNK